MSTIKVTNLKHESSASDNISLDSSANTTIGGNLIAQAGSAATPAIQATGDANTGIHFSGADAVDVATGGTQALQLDSSQNLRFNSGYGSVATAYGVRAWITFNGTSASIGSGFANGGVSSVTDNSTGDYTINFAITFPDNAYSLVGNSGTSGSGQPPVILSLYRVNSTGVHVTPTTTAARVTTSTVGGTPQDGNWVNIAVIR